MLVLTAFFIAFLLTDFFTAFATDFLIAATAFFFSDLLAILCQDPFLKQQTQCLAILRLF